MSTTTHSRPVLRATLGIAALVVIALLANWLVNLSSIGKRGVDFTADKVHTLSDGTKAILGDLDAPVVIRYYATRKSESLPRTLKIYMRKVDDLLRQYATLSDGMLRIEHLDPQPDTDAEDSASIDGMAGRRIAEGNYEENLYHGLAVMCLDKKESLPFLSPGEETHLEYELSRAIAQVSQPKKPIIGVMSALNLPGGPAQMPGQRPVPPWAFYQQLSQAYDVRALGMQPGLIDPSEITVLLILHPAGITPEAEFQIDQFLLKGGTVVACLDPFSVAAQMSSPPNPMMGGGGAPTASTLPKLLKAWGVEFTSDKVLADPKYRTPLSQGRVGYAVLSLTPDAMPNRKKDIITQNLNDTLLLLPGGFTMNGGKGISSSSLLRSSRGAGLVDPTRASRMDQTLLDNMPRDDRAYDLALRLGGTFETAFPDGDPATAADPAATEGGETEPREDSALKKSAKDGSVFLIADADFIYNDFAYQAARMGNSQVYMPNNGNSVLLFNLIDQAAGSKHLIGSRSRASTRRPFTLIQEKEAEFERKEADKIAEFKEDRMETNARLSELQTQKGAGAEMFLSPEQEIEVNKLLLKEAEINRKIRELQKDLKTEKNALSASITILNVLVIPLVVAIVGILVCMRRRITTVAR